MRQTTREGFPYRTTLETRWMDNDAYGHVNNVVYYSFFDTVVNRWLVEQGLLDVAQSPAIGLVVETQCAYFQPLSFPDRIDVGLRVAHIGTSSLRYELAIYRQGDDLPAAAGHFVHVYVDRASRSLTHCARRPKDCASADRS
jgi:acyl-CoA thioester hydrolase